MKHAALVKKILWRLSKITMILGVAAFVLFTVLSNLGGSSESLKKGVEDFINENTPYDARVTTLNYMGFFPDIVLDLNGLELYGKGAATPAVRVEKLVMRASLFDVLFRNQKYKRLDVENAFVAAGEIYTQSLQVRHGTISEDGGEIRYLLTGRIGAQELRAAIALSAEGAGASRRYFIGHDWAFNSLLGEAGFSGVMTKNPETGPKSDLRVQKFNMTLAGAPVLSGTLDIDRVGGGEFGLKGQVDAASGNTVFQPDITLFFGKGPLRIEGKLEAAKLDVLDIAPSSPLASLASAYLAIPPVGSTSLQRALQAPDFSGLDVNVETNIKALSWNGLPLGAAQGPLVLKDSVLSMPGVKGKIAGGDLDGSFSLDPSARPVKFSAKLGIGNMDLSAFSPDLSGKGEWSLDLSASAQTVLKLGSALSGTTAFVGGKPQIPSTLLDTWGKGLGAGLFDGAPADRRLNLECAIAQISFANSLFHLDQFLLAGADVTVLGNGTYDAQADVMDAVLHPKRKGGAAALSLTGPLAELEARPLGFNAGGAGLAGDAFSPDVPSIALSGITLASDHPCASYVIQREELAPPPAPAAE